jgi:uncharacterized protein (TIGR02270 family)
MSSNISAPKANRELVQRPTILAVLHQHIEEVAHLRNVRSVLVRAPHVRLLHLGRLDERIAAHLDGVAVAGGSGNDLARQELERPGVGQVFLVAVRAIEDCDCDALDIVLSIVEAVPESARGLRSALGWVSANALTGIGKTLLRSRSSMHREIGLAACAMHAVDPGAALDEAMFAPDPTLRERAFRVSGQCARQDLLPACLAAIHEANPASAHAAAISALLLGDRDEAIEALESTVMADPGARGREAMELVLKVVSAQRAQALLSRLSEDPIRRRRLLQGVGLSGDVQYMPWLLKQMADLSSSRLAGEAFSLITGTDLAYLDLDRKPPDGVEFVPTADAADANVAMDEDDSLPWPDPVRIEKWWRANEARFAPNVRYFMGEPPAKAHLLSVLKGGFQRQRSAAAQYWSLLHPGTPLFNVRAPTHRQQRLLSLMT